MVLQRRWKDSEQQRPMSINPKPKPTKKYKKSNEPLKKVSSRDSLIKKAHAIMREIVIARDGGCVCPAPEKGHSDVLQAGHIIPSTKPGVRFDLDNVNCQCSSCNGRHGRYEYYYVNWFLFVHGEEKYDRLCKDADRGTLKTYEIEEIIVQLQAIRDRQAEDKEFIPRFTQQEILSGLWRSIGAVKEP